MSKISFSYRITVKQTGETHICLSKCQALVWIEKCEKVLRVWGGEPAFQVEKIITEDVTEQFIK